MLSAASVRQQSAKLVKSFIAPLATVLLSVCSLAAPVYATNTSINVGVGDGLPATLTITTAIDNTTINEPNVTIQGAVHNVTQVIVYVDGTYNTSVPIPSGGGTYTIIFGVVPGTHEVRVAGLDATSGTEVSQTVHFTYDPASAGTGTEAGGTGTGSTSPVDDYVASTIDAAKATGSDAAQQVKKASSSGPLSDLSDITFNALKSVDLISSTDGTGMNKMAGRLTLVSVGLAASVFPWSTYMLIEKIRFIPKLAFSPGLITASMRTVGVVLMMVPFIFIH